MFDATYLSPSHACARVIDALQAVPLDVEEVPIEECYGRVLASDITAPEDLPGFARSTVDGYAVVAADTFGARETAPAYLTLLPEEVMMGKAPAFGLVAGRAAGIPTGGMLPPGADAVVMLEHVTVVSADMVEVLRAVAPQENVIARGEDVRKGARVLARGHRMRPQDVGAMAGLGITEIEVFRRPIVSIISTGDEIVSASGAVKPGQVRDINSYTLWGLIREHGGVPVKRGIYADDYEVLKKAVADALRDADVVLITGGTSAGAKDMTSALINGMGTPGVLFHGVSLKPGKPMIGGVVGNKALFGLPGHPAAVAVCFDLFIRPVLDRLCGRGAVEPFTKTVRATMAKRIASSAGREDHVRVSLELRDDRWVAVPVLGKSGLITTLVKADGVVVIPGGRLGLDEGDEVEVKLFA